MANLKSQERNFWEYFKKIVKGEQKFPFLFKKILIFILKYVKLLKKFEEEKICQ